MSDDIKSSSNHQRLEELHNEAWRWTLACCRGDEELAMEVLQDTYLRVLSNKARFEGRSSFKTWLFGVVRMVTRERWRRAIVTRLLFTPFDDNATKIPNPTEHGRHEHASAILTALKRLPRRQLEIAQLVFFHDLTIEEAAEVQGISVGTARQHYARAKSALRSTLESMGVTAP